MIEQVESKLQGQLTQLLGLNATVKFDMGADGALILDGRQVPATLSREDQDTDCVIKMSGDNLLKLIDGRLNPMLAFATGKLKVAGSTSVAMKLASLLED